MEGETKEKDKESEKGTTETSKSSESLPIVVPVDEPKDVTLFEVRYATLLPSRIRSLCFFFPSLFLCFSFGSSPSFPSSLIIYYLSLIQTRSKLFEFYSENNSWKERGEGRVKLCRLIDTNAFRLGMYNGG